MFLNIQDAINSLLKFNIIYEKQREILKENPECYNARFVEQYMYIYDSRLIVSKCNIIDNLKLYHLRMERKDISHLQLHYAKNRNNRVFYFIIYMEKSEFYLETLDAGIAMKTFFTSWNAGRNWKVKQQIPVEYY